MRIISNKECYIQECDLDYLMDNNKNIPNELFNEFRNNSNDFVKIENPKALQYILESNLPSFNELDNFSINELDRFIFKMKSFLNDTSDKETMSDDELKEFLLEEKNKRYILKQIYEIIKYKKGISTLNYPDIPNPNKGVISNGTTNASMSINIGNVLIYNIDGSPIEEVDRSFCEIAYKLIMSDYIKDENVSLESVINNNYLVIKNKHMKRKLINKTY